MLISALFVTIGVIGLFFAEAKPTVYKPVARRAASPLVASSHVLTLNRKISANKIAARSAAYLLGLHPSPINIPKSHHNTDLVALALGEEFATNITFGTKTFEVIVDTGSSDTWVAEAGFKCVDITTSAPVSEAQCGFGPTYEVSKTFSQIPNVNFNITYQDNEFLTGIFGYEKVTLAGITVNQTIAVVDFAGWAGDDTTSGLVGLGYPALTSEYNGTNATVDGFDNQIIYDPIFTTMYQDGLVAPLFSLAILRNLSGPSGYLSLGGLPPVDFVKDFTSTPILITNIQGFLKTYNFYTINIDEFVLNGAGLHGSGGNIQYIVDSGTTLNYLPTKYANLINNAFDPPAVYSNDFGSYIVDCKAKAPSVGIKIKGTVFYTNPLDMILFVGKDENGEDQCISGIDDGGSDFNVDVFILGDVFQKNVISVFDIGAGQMRFAAREFYPSDDPYRM